MDYRIYADAACDVDKRFIFNNDVKILPMEYSIGIDTIESISIETDAESKRLYDSQRHGDVTHTSQLIQKDYVGFFETLLMHGVGVIYIALSSQLSPSYSEAVKARDYLINKYQRALPFYVIDSQSATAGIGVLVERAIDNKNSGMSIEANYKDVSRLVGTVRIWFYVDNLDYLYAGGRLSKLSAVIGGFLGLKPILRVTPDGSLETIDKKFTAKNAMDRLVELYSTSYIDDYSTVYITHGDDYESAVKLRRLLIAANPKIVIKIENLSPIIGAHTGPSAVLISHLGR